MALSQAQRDAFAEIVERTLLSSQARTALKDLLLALEPYLSTGGDVTEVTLVDADGTPVTVADVGDGSGLTVNAPDLARVLNDLLKQQVTTNKLLVALLEKF